MNHLQQLQDSQIDNPSLELRLMQEIARDDDALLEEMVARRCAREPLSHILESKPFWKDVFIVTPDVLTPRADSETLIEAVVDDVSEAQTILDLGTGSGCLLLSLLREFPQAQGIGVDISEEALKVAQRNADKLGVAERCSWHHGSWETLDDSVKADIVISNPPYIAESEKEGLHPEVRDYEPHKALFAGKEGLDAYQNLATNVPRWLHKNSVLCLEIGIDQAEPVTALFAERFERVASRNDLAGIPRALVFAGYKK